MAVTIGQQVEKLSPQNERHVEDRDPQGLQGGDGVPPRNDGPVGAVTRLLDRQMQRMGRPPVTLKSWTDDVVYDGGSQSVGTIHFRQRPSFWKLWHNPQLCFAESYVDGHVTIDGDLQRVLLALFQSTPVEPLRRDRGGWWRRLTGRRENSLTRSRHNVHHHYDLGNDFYRLWLDRQLLYTCAYFPQPTATLEAAQIAKMDRVCQKIWLKPGERVVEAGCGWGALALHMAKKYHVKVDAYNISREQIAYARERAKAEGLDHLVNYVEDDWRNISGTYDAFVSVGMLEHVGVAHYLELGNVLRRCLPSHGRGLIHSIGRNWPKPLDAWTEKYIFPGAYPPALSEMTEIFESGALSVLDVENLRRHYALTLNHWLQRFEQNVEAIRGMFDERFVRMWRMYLAASAATFEAGALQLFQVAFAPGRNNQIPWSRDGLFPGMGISQNVLPQSNGHPASEPQPLFVPSPIPTGE